MPSFALATYRKSGQLLPAIVIGGNLYDLKLAAKAARVALKSEWANGGIEAIIRDWRSSAAVIKKAGPAIEKAVAAGKLKPVANGSSKSLTSPYRPQRVFCAAANYVEHVNEMATQLAAKSNSKPYMFLKLQNAIVGPGDTVRRPAETTMLDWEVELAVVIGKRARRVSVDKALSFVAGYTIVNDVSARDLNKRSDYPFKFDWFQGKAHDTFCPFGPWIVPAWFVKNPNDMGLKLTVNGSTMQDDNTKNMIWNVREQIAYLSTIVTLEPGDVIATGTPAGVGAGRGVFLQPGDVMEASVAGIGSIRNPVAAE